MIRLYCLTDHQALQLVLYLKKHKCHLTWRILQLQEMYFEVKYRKGTQYHVADALCCYPVEDQTKNMRVVVTIENMTIV